jgi:ubiquitin C-terminal hydrolase
MYQLQCIFGNLQESQKRDFDASGFCAAYKDYDNQPMHHGLQMDVNEFFNVLFDKLEALLKGSPQEKLLDYWFGGKISNQLICKDCPHRSERAETFYILSLEVKNKRSIKESLELYIEGEMLEGDNKYMCQTCQKKVLLSWPLSLSILSLLQL